MTQGPGILLAGGDAGLWSLAGGERRAETRGAKLRGFSSFPQVSLPLFSPSAVLSCTLFLALSEEALMRIPLIRWGLTGTQTTLHLIPPFTATGATRGPTQHWAQHRVGVRLVLLVRHEEVILCIYSPVWAESLRWNHELRLYCRVVIFSAVIFSPMISVSVRGMWSECLVHVFMPDGSRFYPLNPKCPSSWMI